MSASTKKIEALIIGTSVVQSLRRVAPDQRDVFREELMAEPFYYCSPGQKEIPFNYSLIDLKRYNFFFKEAINEPSKLFILLINLYTLLELEEFQEIFSKDDMVKSFIDSLKQTIASCLQDLEKINLFMKSQENGLSENHFAELNEFYGNSDFSDMHANKIFKLITQLSRLEALIRPQQEILSNLMDKLRAVRAHILASPYRPAADPSHQQKDEFRRSLAKVRDEIKKQGGDFFIKHADIFGGEKYAGEIQAFFNSDIDIDALEQGIIHNSKDPLKEGSNFKRDVDADIYLKTVLAISMSEQTARAYLCNALLQIQVFQYLSRLQQAIAATIKGPSVHPVAANMKDKIDQFNQFKTDEPALTLLEKLYAEDKSENSLQALLLGKGIFKRGTFDIYSPLDEYLRTLPKEKHKKELEALGFLKSISRLNYKKEYFNKNDIKKIIKKEGFLSKLVNFKLVSGDLDATEIGKERARLNRLSPDDFVKEVAELAEKTLIEALPVLESFSQTEYFLMITQYNSKLPPHPKTNNSLGPNNELSLLLNEMKKVREINKEESEEISVAGIAAEHFNSSSKDSPESVAIEGSCCNSLRDTPSPLDNLISVGTFFEFSSSSASEAESSLVESPRKDGKESDSVALIEETTKTGSSFSNSIHHAPRAFSFFETQPGSIKEEALPQVSKNPNTIFNGENVEKERKGLFISIKRKGTVTQKDIPQILNFSAAGDAAGLFLLAQVVLKGKGGLKKDPAAAAYLAELALNRTEKKDSRAKIRKFLGKIPDRYKNAECLSGLKIRLPEREYNPKELLEAYLAQESIVQVSKVSMRCSQ